MTDPSMRQTSDIPPLWTRCHTDDPGTSREAAEKAFKSGTTAEHRTLILLVLGQAKHPLTASEIGARCGLDQWQVNRRMKEITAAEPCGERPCTFRKSKCTTYKLKEQTT